MDKKTVLIAIIVVAVIAVIGGFFLLNNNATPSGTITDHSTIVLSKSAYMEVPKNPNATGKADKKGIFRYNDNNDDINITSCSNLSADSSVKEMKKLKNSIATGAKKIKENNVVIFEKNGTYSVFVKNTEYNDTLLIQSSNKDLLLQCWNTVKYHDPTHKIKFNDTTGSSGTSSVINAAEQTEKVVQKSTSTSSSSSSSSSSSTAGTGSGGYSDFGFGGSSSSSSGSSKASGSSGGGYSDFGFD